MVARSVTAPSRASRCVRKTRETNTGFPMSPKKGYGMAKRKLLSEEITITVKVVPKNTRKFNCNHHDCESGSYVHYDHRPKDGMTMKACNTSVNLNYGYTRKCRLLICNEHWEAHEQMHLMQRLAHKHGD